MQDSPIPPKSTVCKQMICKLRHPNVQTHTHIHTPNSTVDRSITAAIDTEAQIHHTYRHTHTNTHICRHTYLYACVQYIHTYT